jgi:hypothetical protein
MPVWLSKIVFAGFAQFVEAGERPSKVSHLPEKSVINVIRFGSLFLIWQSEILVKVVWY